MARLFAIGDIHGCATELAQLLDLISPQATDTLVFLGDYIDRGPDSKAVIDHILTLKKHCNIIALRGNHEAMLLDFLRFPQSEEGANYIFNGGTATLTSYKLGDKDFQISPEHLNFYNQLPYWYKSEDFVFVHAGLPLKPLAQIDLAEDAFEMMWIREPFLSANFAWGKTVVHGHTPVDYPEVSAQRINVDTGCIYGGKLTAIELPSQKLYQVERLPMQEYRYLADAGSQRIARRFTGKTLVEVRRPSGIVVCETVNYNEFGLLLKSLVSAGLIVGERIQGTIGRFSRTKVPFVGVVVREQRESSGEVLYGIKLENIDRDLFGKMRG